MENRLQSLCEGLSSPDMRIRDKSAFDLGMMRGDAAEAIENLLAAYFKEDPLSEATSSMLKAIERIVFGAADEGNLKPGHATVSRINAEMKSSDPRNRQKATWLTEHVPH